MRAAVVGGVAYHAGKKVQEGRYEDDETQARLDQLEQQQYASQQYQQAPPQPSSGITDEAIEQLKKLSQLKDAGVLTDAEFEEQKRKLLSGS
jgi:hypothetical protein